MPRQIFTAPADLDKLDKLEGPLVYLNGPIQGAENWQASAIAVLGEIAPDLHVASPRARNFAGGVEKHLAWEQGFVERAAKDGVVMFWLAREAKHRNDRTYAAQMRFELGEWAVKSSAGLARLVVGIESSFPGGAYLKRRLTLTYPNIPICRTLQQACAAAAELARHDAPTILYPRTLAEMFTPSFGFRNNG